MIRFLIYVKPHDSIAFQIVLTGSIVKNVAHKAYLDRYEHSGNLTERLQLFKDLCHSTFE